MIRGFAGVVPAHAAQPGRFYMSAGYGNGPWLFQCISTRSGASDTPQTMALIYSIDGKPELTWSGIPDYGPLIALFDVHVRIDPTSISGHAEATSLQPKMLIVDGETPIVCVPIDQGFNRININISEGARTFEALGLRWMSFKRWSLVMDDEAGDELTLVSFGQD